MSYTCQSVAEIANLAFLAFIGISNLLVFSRLFFIESHAGHQRNCWKQIILHAHFFACRIDAINRPFWRSSGADIRSTLCVVLTNDLGGIAQNVGGVLDLSTGGQDLGRGPMTETMRTCVGDFA